MESSSSSLELEYSQIEREHKPRRYNSPERVDRAQATGREILRAAERLFASDGYASVTMKDIAHEAGVAPATVYLHFARKGSIVQALARAITDDPDLSVEQVEGVASVREQIRLGVSILRRLNERSWVVAEILRMHAGADPELQLLREDWQRRHIDAVTRGVAAVAHSGQLRSALTAEEAADILYAVAGTDVYRALVRERGWSPSAYESWLARFIDDHLMARS